MLLKGAGSESVCMNNYTADDKLRAKHSTLFKGSSFKQCLRNHSFLIESGDEIT